MGQRRPPYGPPTASPGQPSWRVSPGRGRAGRAGIQPGTGRGAKAPAWCRRPTERRWQSARQTAPRAATGQGLPDTASSQERKGNSVLPKLETGEPGPGLGGGGGGARRAAPRPGGPRGAPPRGGPGGPSGLSLPSGRWSVPASVRLSPGDPCASAPRAGVWNRPASSCCALSRVIRVTSLYLVPPWAWLRAQGWDGPRTLLCGAPHPSQSPLRGRRSPSHVTEHEGRRGEVSVPKSRPAPR